MKDSLIRWKLPILLVISVAGGVLAVWWWTQPVEEEQAGPALELAEGMATPDFVRALKPRPFEFPEDHGPHPRYRSEWWYYTGNVWDLRGARLAYQLTIFRQALAPQSIDRQSHLAANQIYFAHFALADPASGEHWQVERFSRGAGGLAGAQSDPLRVWLHDWSIEALDEQGEAVRIRAEQGSRSLDLSLRALKPIVAHGDSGLSRKGEEPGNASYYLSYTRMVAEGEIVVDEQMHTVRGESWFDHEWGTSALPPQAVGWDWFGLQLDDGSELMFGQIRRQDGALEPMSHGSFVLASGEVVALGAQDVSVGVTDHWTSGHSGAVYPSGWIVRIPLLDLELAVEPLMANQEMELTITYWEGAVDVSGRRAGQAVSGHGFVELSGYAHSLQGIY